MQNRWIPSILSSTFLLTVAARFQAAGWDTEKIIIAITGSLAVLSSLVGVINTAKNDAFRNLQSVNQDLRTSILERDATIRALKAYQRVLVKVLQDKGIDIPDEE